jgi:rubrerythrin
VDDVIGMAIAKEEKAMEFYRQCAAKAQNPSIQQFFQEMSKEEERHRDLLKSLDPETVGELKADKVQDLGISEYLMDVSFTEDLTYQEALILAMKKEEKAHAFYSAWKDKCMNENTGKLFELLAAEELKHKAQIETIYDDDILEWD